MEAMVEEALRARAANWQELFCSSSDGGEGVHKEWPKRCIYRVPAYIKENNSRAYMPHVVSLGPYHHGEEPLRPMEEHKRRALAHFLRRCEKPLESFMVAVWEVSQELKDAYEQLDDGWWGDPTGLVEMLVIDGCFMLEFMRSFNRVPSSLGYDPDDPIFGPRGMDKWGRAIVGDMMLLENQLPFLLLEKLLAVESPGTTQGLNSVVWDFLYERLWRAYKRPTGGLHLLDFYLKSCVYGRTPAARVKRRWELVFVGDVWPATDLSEAGIRFKKSNDDILNDIYFKDGVLTLPEVNVDGFTITVLHNLVAFERQHVGSGSDVSSYVYFMNSMLHSAKDVGLLHSKGIILRTSTDEEVVKTFSTAAKETSVRADCDIGIVLWQIAQHRRRMWPRWRFRIVHTYFSIPGRGYSLVGALVVLGLTVAQVVYGALQYYQAKSGP